MSDEANAIAVERVNENKTRTDVLLEALLAEQVAEARLKAKRGKIQNGLLTTFGLVLTAMATYFGTAATRQPTDEEAEQKAAPVIEKVDKDSKAVTRRVEVNERKIDALKDYSLEQQVQLSDGFTYIEKKIDAFSPRTADKVDKPDSLEKAKKKADAIKESRKEQLFDPKDADPFADIKEDR